MRISVIINKIRKISFIKKSQTGMGNVSTDIPINTPEVQKNTLNNSDSFQNTQDIEDKANWISRSWTGGWEESDFVDIFMFVESMQPDWFLTNELIFNVKEAISVAAQKSQKQWTKEEVFEWVRKNGVDATPDVTLVSGPMVMEWYQEALQNFDNELNENEVAPVLGISGQELANEFLDRWANEPINSIPGSGHSRYNDEVSITEYFSEKHSSDWVGLLQNYVFKDVADGYSSRSEDFRISYFLPKRKTGKDRSGLIMDAIGNNLPTDVQSFMTGQQTSMTRSDVFRYLYNNEMDNLSAILLSQIDNDPDIVNWVDSKLHFAGKAEEYQTHQFTQDEGGALMIPEEDRRQKMIDSGEMTVQERKERTNAQKGRLSDMMETLSDLSEDVYNYLGTQVESITAERNKEAYLKSMDWIKAIGTIIPKTIEEAFNSDPRKTSNEIGVVWDSGTGQIVPKAGINEWDSVKWSRFVNMKSIGDELHSGVMGEGLFPQLPSSPPNIDPKSERYKKYQDDLRKHLTLIYRQTELLLDKAGRYLIEEASDKYPKNVLLAFLDLTRTRSDTRFYGNMISNDGGEVARNSYMKNLMLSSPAISKKTIGQDFDESDKGGVKGAPKHLTPPLVEELNRITSTVSPEQIDSMTDAQVQSMIYPFMMYEKFKYWLLGRGSSISSYKAIMDLPENIGGEISETSLPGELWKNKSSYTDEERAREQQWLKKYVPPEYMHQGRKPREANAYIREEMSYFIVKEALSQIDDLKFMRNNFTKVASNSFDIDILIEETKVRYVSKLELIGQCT